MYYDKSGEPIDLMKWAKYFEDLDYKVIARDMVGGNEVSTVWLGINHNFSDDGAPVIFETMVFPNEDWDGDELYMNRYSTEAEALEGHKEAIEVAKTLEVHDEATD